MISALLDGGEVRGKKLMVLDPGQQRAAVVFPEEGKSIGEGDIYAPSWNPDSHYLAFALDTKSGERAICTIAKDGTGFKNITQGKGKFSSPQFSPQRASSGR